MKTIVSDASPAILTDNRTARYRNVYPDTDLEWRVGNGYLKETLILRSRQSPAEFSFVLASSDLAPLVCTSSGFAPVSSAATAAGQSVNVSGLMLLAVPTATTDRRILIPHPVIADSSGRKKVQLRCTISQTVPGAGISLPRTVAAQKAFPSMRTDFPVRSRTQLLPWGNALHVGKWEVAGRVCPYTSEEAAVAAKAFVGKELPMIASRLKWRPPGRIRWGKQRLSDPLVLQTGGYSIVGELTYADVPMLHDTINVTILGETVEFVSLTCHEVVQTATESLTVENCRAVVKKALPEVKARVGLGKSYAILDARLVLAGPLDRESEEAAHRRCSNTGPFGRWFSTCCRAGQSGGTFVPCSSMPQRVSTLLMSPEEVIRYETSRLRQFAPVHEPNTESHSDWVYGSPRLVGLPLGFGGARERLDRSNRLRALDGSVWSWLGGPWHKNVGYRRIVQRHGHERRLVFLGRHPLGGDDARSALGSAIFPQLG